jgi:hypothetical protein
MSTLKELGDYTIHEGDDGSCTYGAKLGCFDDLVMSYAIALELLLTIPKARDEREKANEKNKPKNVLFESAEDVKARSY